MDTVLTVTLPVFALVAAGYLAGRRGLIAEPAVAGLNGFVFYFALPAFLFVKLAQTPIREAFDWRLLAAYHAAGLGVFALAMALGRLLWGHGLATLAVQGAAATFGNVGYMGLALVIGALGERATFPAVLIVVGDVTLTLSLAVALVEAGTGGPAGWRQVPGAVAASLVRNPLVLAVAAGAALAVGGPALPAPVRAFGELLGAAALPGALFALGGALVASRTGGAAAEVALLVALKLLVHPLAVWAAAACLFRLDPLLTAVAVVQASLPAAANVYVIAQRYEVYVDRASGTVLLSTAASVVTVSALLALLR